MSEASANLNYEKAAEYRDRLQAMAQVSTVSGGVNPETFKDGDVIGIHSEGGQSCVQVFFFRSGLNWGNSSHFPRHSKDESPAQIVDAFIAQFYLNKPIPREIFVSEDVPNCEILEQGLSERAERNIKISTPKRGEKKMLINRAVKNAQEALARKMAETASQQRLLKQVQEVFDLEDMPQRIEVYDNSHIQGANAIGAFIVAGLDGFERCLLYTSPSPRDQRGSPMPSSA